MRLLAPATPYICPRCLRVRHQASQAEVLRPNILPRSRYLSTSTISRSADHGAKTDNQQEEERGAMSRRLSELSEESLETGGRSARKAIEEAGFDEDLKRRLEQKIADANFRNEYASAFAQADLPASAGKGTRDIAGAQPWSGTETVEDASLRMLNDAYKPLKVKAPSRPPPLRGPPPKVDTGRPVKASSGARLANARDRTSMYAFMKDPSMSEKERERYRKELKERFTPAGRTAPASIKGLQSLANERIEDAIARGQFKNLPRGKKIERDYNMSSPFLDTTEYFMNKIIQKQDIVPPWIEKQQELVSTATKFRGRLRADWKRHVARLIASKGGSLDSQIKLAEAYAAAEAIDNPPKRKVEKFNTVDDDGHVSQITLAGELKATEDPVAASQPATITVTEQTVDPSGNVSPAEQHLTIASEVQTAEVTAEPPQPPTRPSVPPFRDPQWLETERSYHNLAIENLNTITRSYNLMAPNLAKKPYFSLERELRACYADVAPLVADEIRERANAPRVRVETIGHKPGGVLERFAGEKANVYDSRRPHYGFKEFWRDLWQRET